VQLWAVLGKSSRTIAF